VPHCPQKKLMSRLNPAYRVFASWPCENYIQSVPRRKHTSLL